MLKHKLDRLVIRMQKYPQQLTRKEIEMVNKIMNSKKDIEEALTKEKNNGR